MRKQLLAPGTYWTWDPKSEGFRPTTFTRADLDRAEVEGRRMLADGIEPPLLWEHQQDGHLPMSQAERLKASVTATAGWMKGLSRDADGSLYADLDVRDEEARRKIADGTVKFVSPLMHPAVTAGNGETYKGVVAHVALTSKPVWAGQKPFGSDGAALSLGVSDASEPTAASDLTEPVCLSLETAIAFAWESKKMPKDQDTGMYDDLDENDEAEDNTGKDKDKPDGKGFPEPKGGGGGDAALLAKASAVLHRCDIVVAPTGDCREFLQHMINAVETHLATKGGDSMPLEQDDQQDKQDMTPPREEPQVVAMSLRLSNAEAMLADSNYKLLDNEIAQLVKDGQMSPARANKVREVLGGKKLSLVQGGPEADRAQLEVEIARDTPKGTHWSAEQKAMELSKASEAPGAPEWDGQGEMTDKKADEVLDAQHGKAK